MQSPHGFITESREHQQSNFANIGVDTAANESSIKFAQKVVRQLDRLSWAKHRLEGVAKAVSTAGTVSGLNRAARRCRRVGRRQCSPSTPHIRRCWSAWKATIRRQAEEERRREEARSCRHQERFQSGIYDNGCVCRGVGVRCGKYHEI